MADLTSAPLRGLTPEEAAFDIEIPDAAAEELKTFGQVVDYLVKKLGAGDAVEEGDRCMACAAPLKDGDLVLNDVSGGVLHVTCCGPEREGYVGADGEPLKPGEPIPEGYAWTPAGEVQAA